MKQIVAEGIEQGLVESAVHEFEQQARRLARIYAKDLRGGFSGADEEEACIFVCAASRSVAMFSASSLGSTVPD